MKKMLLGIVMALLLLNGSLPVTAAAGTNDQLFWTGSFDEPNWLGVNLTVVDGKKNETRRLYKGAATSLAVVGDWIYFLKQDPDSEVIMGNIVKMKKDGSKLTEVTKGNDIQQFYVEGQSIYFGGYDRNYNFQLGVMSLNGTGKKILLSKAQFWSYSAIKGFVFYVDMNKDSRLYRIKQNGSGKTAISAGKLEEYGSFALYGDTLYYAEIASKGTTKWYLSDLDGKNKKALASKGTLAPISYRDKWFYYEETVRTSKTTVRSLQKIKRDGTGKQAVSNLSPNDRFIGLAGAAFVYKAHDGTIYQIGQDGKITNPTKS
ncbi:DUF5050 domain-containing protein [Cohnella faecalis]|uniref:DUF5050 domain-containing protein n=1 Tax=Cohnella faecalis TaxID=2315694 RepID=A0A398CFA1_9BACL|nr:DUF5050 domain-containing protein [Cohnella faecalis]RIE01085.1 DUF5050 domain-containing protein [Cohnella faecalis]